MRITFWCLFSFALLTSTTALAQPVTWQDSMGGNGHSYEAVYVPAGLSWEEASTLANARGGYLVTLTSEAEQQWVFDNIANDPRFVGTDPNRPSFGPWIGLYQDTSSADYLEPDGGWRWVTGEELIYHNWNIGEPNNQSSQGDENYAHYVVNVANYGTWNDCVDTGATIPNSYIVEYEPVCLADVNQDGVLTPADFSSWIAAFVLLGPGCDQNGDGECTAADFSSWVANYNLGC